MHGVAWHRLFFIIRIALIAVARATSDAAACPACGPAVKRAIFDEHLWPRMAMTLLPFLAIAIAVDVIARSIDRRAAVKARGAQGGGERPG